MTKALAAVLLFATALTAFALAPGGQTLERLDQRIADIDFSLERLRADVSEGRIPDAQKSDAAAMQKSLEAEKALLLERKDVLKRLETPGTSVDAGTPTLQSATPAGPAALSPLAPLSSPKPRIPDEVCQQRLSGWVGLEFAVLPDGKVADVRVTASEPKGAFDSAAVESVSARTYALRAEPLKLRERLFMSFSDCRAEQLRVSIAADAAPASQEDCPVIASEARKAGDPIDAAESGRAVLAGEGAQVFSAPSPRCFATGKKLKPGSRLIARIEYKEYSLVSNPKGADEVWVRSNQLKDTTP